MAAAVSRRASCASMIARRCCRGKSGYGQRPAPSRARGGRCGARMARPAREEAARLALADDALEADRASQPRRGTLQRIVEAAADARLGRELPDPEDALAAVGLQVGAADEPVSDEQREDVIAVDPLRLALVDLDHVHEPEEPREEWPVPHQVVERTQENGAGGSAVEFGAGGHDDPG